MGTGKKTEAARTAFTLLELLVAIAIIGILAALLLPALGRAKAEGKRTICIGNLSQIDKAVALYASDNSDTLFPFVEKPANSNFSFLFFQWSSYVPLIGRYVGWKGAPSPQDKVFACPADTFHYDGNIYHWVGESLCSQSNVNYSSYVFNAGNAVFQGVFREKTPEKLPGVLGWKLGAITTPSRTFLVAEYLALDSLSWHKPAPRNVTHFNNAPDVLGFADGHVAYVKMYAGSNNPSGQFADALAYDPPPGYDYKLSGN